MMVIKVVQIKNIKLSNKLYINILLNSIFTSLSSSLFN